MNNKEQKIQPTSVSGNSTKPNVLRRTVEVCWLSMDDKIIVHYRAEEGTDFANNYIAQVNDIKARQGDKCRYSIRMA